MKTRSVKQHHTFTAIGSLSGSPVKDNFALERIAFPKDVYTHVNNVNIEIC